MHSIQAIYVLRRSQNRKRTVGASSWRFTGSRNFQRGSGSFRRRRLAPSALHRVVR